MSMNAERARSAFSATAQGINQQLGDYRKDVDNINAFNKNLKNTFKTAEEMKALRDIGSEVGVRALKQFGTKYLKSAYEFKIPKAGVSISDLDEKAGQYLGEKAGPYLQKAKGALEDAKQGIEDAFRQGRKGAMRSIRRFSAGDPEAEVEMRQVGNESVSEPYEDTPSNPTASSRDPQNYETKVEEGDEIAGEDGDAMEDAMNNFGEMHGLNENTGEADLSFEDYMNQFDTPRTETGDIDFERADNQFGMGMEDRRSRALREQGNIDETNQAREAENMGAEDYDASQMAERQGMESEDHNVLAGEDAEVTAGQENVGNEAQSLLGDEAKSDSATVAENAKIKADSIKENGGEEDLDGAGEELGEEGAEEGAELGGEEGAVGALEGVGTALDATGIFAPLGALFNLAGAGVEAFTAYEAGKGVVDWVKDDVLGQGPKAPQQAIPKMQRTLAQRGMMVVPTTDSIDTQQAVPGW